MVTVEPGVSARDPGRSGRLMRPYSNTKMLSGSLQVNISGKIDRVYMDMR